MNGRLVHTASSRDAWTITVPARDDAATVASWSTTAAEAAAWVSELWTSHPGDRPGVVAPARRRRVATSGPRRHPVAYGEVWDDAEEDEVELARLIVDPARRREGVGRRLVGALLDLAGSYGRSACFLRVVPDNVAARALYRCAGFVEVDQALMDEWNVGQSAEYVWMQQRGSS